VGGGGAQIASSAPPPLKGPDLLESGNTGNGL
jgi:hypothetical protein